MIPKEIAVGEIEKANIQLRRLNEVIENLLRHLECCDIDCAIKASEALFHSTRARRTLVETQLSILAEAIDLDLDISVLPDFCNENDNMIDLNE